MLRILLYPLAVLYDIVTSVRNTLYDRGQKPSAVFNVPVIGIGNLAVGGTGKTPMVEYLVKLLNPPFRIATLSRGYGRNTSGFRLATEKENASTIGDEPFQLYKKFKDHIVVAVGEERALAITTLMDEHPDTEVILMDDAFQHRRVRPSFQILLTDYHRPFFRDLLLPAGRLRESARGAGRANAIVVTKCPHDMHEDEMMRMEEVIRDYSDKPVFFSTIHYGTPIAVEYPGNFQPKVVLVSGIANEKPFEHYVRQHYELVRHFVFADHHRYTRKEAETFLELAEKETAVILTTEKDAVKFLSGGLEDIIRGKPFFYLPIELEFLKNGKEFDEMVLNVLQTRHVS